VNGNGYSATPDGAPGCPRPCFDLRIDPYTLACSGDNEAEEYYAYISDSGPCPELIVSSSKPPAEVQSSYHRVAIRADGSLILGTGEADNLAVFAANCSTGVPDPFPRSNTIMSHPHGVPWELNYQVTITPTGITVGEIIFNPM